MSICVSATIGLLNCLASAKKTSANSELACIVSGVSLSVGTAERLQQKPETEPHWHCQAAVTVSPPAHHLVVAACMPEQRH